MLKLDQKVITGLLTLLSSKNKLSGKRVIKQRAAWILIDAVWRRKG